MTVANIITVVRILIIPFFISVVLYYSREKDYMRYIALAVFLVAAASDALDGYVARVHRQKTQLGAMLDPLADKILLMSAFACLYKVGEAFDAVHFPIWLIVIVISRDLILLLGALIIHLILGSWDIRPSLLGKTTTVFQMASVVSLLLQWPQSYLLWDVTAALTVISGLDYILLGFKEINRGGVAT